MKGKLYFRWVLLATLILLFSTVIANADEIDLYEQETNAVNAKITDTYNSWKNENGNRYYVDGNGEYAKGIYEVDNVIYYFNPETGALVKEAGWREWNGKRYFTNAEGIAYRNQFITFGPHKFYMGEDGAAKTGIFFTSDGRIFNADETGEVINKAQWIEKDGKRYFSNSEGELYKNQFISFGEHRYYMGEDGAVLIGTFTAIDGRVYKSDNTGETIKQKAQWIEQNGKRYFITAEGNLYRNQFITFGPHRFYMGADGSATVGIFKTNDGRMYYSDETGEVVRKAQWIEKDGKRYFSNAEGEIYRNQFITFGPHKFYMGANGEAQTGIFALPDQRLFNADDVTGEIIQKAQWIKKNGNKYFSNAEGELYRRRFISFGDTFYYVNSKGQVSVHSFFLNESGYATDSEGVVKELMGHIGTKTLGINVSSAQGDINWKKVAKSGIKFAIIRASYRDSKTGKIIDDEYFEKNVKGATEAGLRVGAYFSSQAINENEIYQETNHVIKQIKNHNLMLGVAIEADYSNPNSRTKGLTKEEKANLVHRFCININISYNLPIIFASDETIANHLDMRDIKGYKIWVAQHSGPVKYPGRYYCWQYSTKGIVDGISGYVGMNYWYNQ